jgi:hypothetical protein
MHHSLGASSKQLTHFFDTQKNLSFSLENNYTVNTYIHSNDWEPIRSEPLSPPLMYSVTFLEFEENNSLNWKNNYFASDYMSFNSSDNSLSKLTSLNSLPMLFSSVLSHCESEQHLDSNTVFSSLPPLSPNLSYLFKVDSSYTNSEFEDFLLHFTYESFTSSFFSPPNNTADSPMILEQFVAFYQLSIHVFSSLSFFYYSLH